MVCPKCGNKYTFSSADGGEEICIDCYYAEVGEQWLLEKRRQRNECPGCGKSMTLDYSGLSKIGNHYMELWGCSDCEAWAEIYWPIHGPNSNKDKNGGE